MNSFRALNTNLNNRFVYFTPFFNPDKSSSQSFSAGGSGYIYMIDNTGNELIGIITRVGSGQYFYFKKIGYYRIIIHLASSNSATFTISLKNSDNTTKYKQTKGLSQQTIELFYYANDTTSAYLLYIESDVATTLYSDKMYSWCELEYLGE